MKTKVYVLYGGKSVEHEVSLQSALSVINALDRDKYDIYPIYVTREGLWCDLGVPKDKITDVSQLKAHSSNTISSSLGEFLNNHFNEDRETILFPVFHGTNGEDGTVQGLLELLDIPYVGNGVLSSAIGIDKAVMKDLFTKGGIPQGKYTVLTLHDWAKDQQHAYDQIETSIGYPCFVKPARLGSSVGINRCQDRKELYQAIEEAFLYDHKLVIEEELIGREMQIAVLGNECPQCSVVGEYIQERSFMDYNAKYVDGKLVAVIPAQLPAYVSEEMQRVAIQAFKLLNCQGLLRVDYFVTDQNQFFINEVNTMPGFTKFSMFPALWEKTDGTSYSQLLEKLMELAVAQYQQKKSILNTRWEK